MGKLLTASKSNSVTTHGINNNNNQINYEKYKIKEKYNSDSLIFCDF